MFNMMRFNSMENYEGDNKMIMNNQREKYVQAKEEGDEDNNNPLVDNKQISRLSIPSTTSSSRQWGGFKNPRIVRVSRAFGGKDRHSKVYTVRGLRDRRIRLSVPTAIQLYDLQDRLGLKQPSKVVDWLIDVTKDEIDKLPPLQLPPGGFFPHDYSSSILASHSPVFGSHPFERGNNLTSSSKDHQENLENYEGYVSHHPQLSAQNFFPLGNQTSSLQGLLNNNNGLSYNPNYLHWEPGNLSLSQFGNHSFDSRINNSSNTTCNKSSSALQPSGSSHHQLYFCPSIPTVPSMISPTYPPPFMNLSSSIENEQSRQMMINNFQISSSSSSQHGVQNSLMPTTLHLVNSPEMKPFGFNFQR